MRGALCPKTKSKNRKRNRMKAERRSGEETTGTSIKKKKTALNRPRTIRRRLPFALSQPLGWPDGFGGEWKQQGRLWMKTRARDSPSAASSCAAARANERRIDEWLFYASFLIRGARLARRRVCVFDHLGRIGFFVMWCPR